MYIIVTCVCVCVCCFAGPASPNSVVLLNVLNIREDTATIQWRVTSLTYDPETYVVEYGTTASNLDMTSSVVSSGVDIIVINFELCVVLENLAFNTEYSYRVVATNSAGSTRTPAQGMTPAMFTTTNPCKYKFMLI